MIKSDFFHLNPITVKRLKKFRKIRRAYYSFIIVMITFGISLFSEILANDSPLMVSYRDQWYFPVFKVYKGSDFGWNYPTEPDYKAEAEEIRRQGWLVEPLIWWGYNETNKKIDKYPGAPSSDNWLGTDNRGRDVGVRLLYGFRISMTFAWITLLFAMVLGTMVGGVQGFWGGRVDLWGQRLVEIWSSLPYLFMVLLIVNIFEPSLMVLILILAIFSWMSTSYYMRAECLRLKNQEFALAAKSLGASKSQVFFQHIVPNAITPLVTLMPFIMSLAVAALSFLDYLGLGVQPPTASIGELLKQGRENFLFAWWLAVYPFFVLTVTLVLINFVGEGVRKAFDPRATV